MSKTCRQAHASAVWRVFICLHTGTTVSPVPDSPTHQFMRTRIGKRISSQTVSVCAAWLASLQPFLTASSVEGSVVCNTSNSLRMATWVAAESRLCSNTGPSGISGERQSNFTFAAFSGSFNTAWYSVLPWQLSCCHGRVPARTPWWICGCHHTPLKQNPLPGL